MIPKRKRCFLGFIFVTSCLSIGLIVAAAATDNWVVAQPERKVDRDTQIAANNLNESAQSKFHGQVNIGLFHGMKTLDNGLGTSGRGYEIWVTVTLGSNQPFNAALWISCIVFLALTVAWALISAGFSLLNMNRKPVETVSGPLGLYLWNLFAVISLFIAIILYIVLFYQNFAVTVMTKSEREQLNWSSLGRTWFSYSFYLAVGALGPLLLNFVLVYCSGSRMEFGKRDKSDGLPNNMDRVMMY